MIPRITEDKNMPILFLVIRLVSLIKNPMKTISSDAATIQIRENIICKNFGTLIHNFSLNAPKFVKNKI